MTSEETQGIDGIPGNANGPEQSHAPQIPLHEQYLQQNQDYTPNYQSIPSEALRAPIMPQSENVGQESAQNYTSAEVTSPVDIFHNKQQSDEDAFPSSKPLPPAPRKKGKRAFIIILVALILLVLAGLAAIFVPEFLSTGADYDGVRGDRIVVVIPE
jgi:hypothetical protein